MTSSNILLSVSATLSTPGRVLEEALAQEKSSAPAENQPIDSCILLR